MKAKTIIGIVLIVIGAGCLFFSHYIMTQVNEGKIKVAKGEEAVKQSNQLFSLTPGTQQAGKLATSGAQKKLNEGKKTIQDYEALSEKLQVGGIIALVAGGVLVLLGLCEKKKRR